LKISIVIPTYNDLFALKQNTPVLLEYIQHSEYVWELILVDDGSSERKSTETFAQTNGFKFIALEKNLGKGASVRKGISKATGDFIIYTDADIPFECSAIDKVLHYLIEKEFDVVIGDRGLIDSNYFNQIAPKRKFGSGIFTFFVGRFVTTGFSDTQCGLKGFKSSVAVKLCQKAKINGFAFDVELLYLALKWNLDIKKIPVTLRSADGNSVNLWKHGPQMVLDLFRVKWFHLKGLYHE
jgi:dolichyl-phosphate beta-glucosyltransferase